MLQGLHPTPRAAGFSLRIRTARVTSHQTSKPGTDLRVLCARLEPTAAKVRPMRYCTMTKKLAVCVIPGALAVTSTL